jgi:hypothetical protein
MNYPNTVLVEFVKERRNGKNNMVGTFIGFKENGSIRTGWSRCHADIDIFDKELGVAFACQNILIPKTVPVGRNFSKKYANFQERCSRYFKDAKGIPSSTKAKSKGNVKTVVPVPTILKGNDKAADIFNLLLSSLLTMPFETLKAPAPAKATAPVVPVQQEKVVIALKSNPIKNMPKLACKIRSKSKV